VRKKLASFFGEAKYLFYPFLFYYHHLFLIIFNHSSYSKYLSKYIIL
jgi:hypothetical protein